MESKSFVKILRKVIREEVRSAVKELLAEQQVNHDNVMDHGMNLHELANSIVVVEGDSRVLSQKVAGEILRPYKNTWKCIKLIVDIFLPPAEPDSSFQVREHNVLSFEVIDNLDRGGARGSFPSDWQRGEAGFMMRPELKFDTQHIKDI